MGNARSTGRSVIMADCGECSNDAGAVEGTEFGHETVDPNGAETEAPPPNGRDGCRVVKTTKGYVVGRRLIVSDATADGQERAVDYYLGIPYAKPPILPELRFKKPQPHDSWKGVRDASKFGPRCMQKDWTILERIKRGAPSEDCLYLNVFAPAFSPNSSAADADSGAATFPVMVFVHGGGFCIDSTRKYGDVGICRHLVARREVLVVTIQYRLGLFGFFTTGDDACDDNVGLWDQTAALQWIHDNITAFGGDPNNVTLFGQSAGGVSVDLLSLSPHSRNLFHRVIPMAGNADVDWAINDNAVEFCRRFANQLGICSWTNDSKQLVEKMRHVPANKLALGMSFDNFRLGRGDLRLLIGPRIDGDFLPRSIAELRSEAPPKPKLIGLCEHEGLLLSLLARNPSIGLLERFVANHFPESDFPDDFKERRLALLQQLLGKSQPAVIENLSEQPQVESQKIESTCIKRGFTNLYSDIFLGIGTQRSVLNAVDRQKRNKTNAENTYLYSFNYFNPKALGPFSFFMPFKGATHCIELPYLFETGIIWQYKFNLNDKLMLEMITKLWSNFAKYGDPNGSEDVSDSNPFPQQPHLKWLPASSERPDQHLSIDLTPTMKEEGFQGGRPLRWIELLNKKAPN